MWSDVQLAYLAGIIDGEGSIYIQTQIREDRKSAIYNSHFKVANTDKKMIDWLHNIFGGTQYVKKRNNPKWRTQYEWFAGIKLTDNLLPLIIPFLVTKKEHAKIMVEFRNTFTNHPGRGGVASCVLDYRLECLHKLKLLNKRGL